MYETYTLKTKNNCLFYFMALGFELWASHLLGRSSTI
jgi:hypothetical protein